VDHFETLSDSLASVRIHFNAIAVAVQDGERGPEIVRQLVVTVLNELSPITEVVDLDEYVSGLLGRAKTVGGLKREYRELSAL
jgi:hypothetical protein